MLLDNGPFAFTKRPIYLTFSKKENQIAQVAIIAQLGTNMFGETIIYHAKREITLNSDQELIQIL